MTENPRRRHRSRDVRFQKPSQEVFDLIAANPLATPDEIPLAAQADSQTLSPNIAPVREIILTGFMARIMEMEPVVAIQPDKKRAYSEFAFNKFEFYRVKTNSAVVPVVHIVQTATESGRRAYQRMLDQFLNQGSSRAINPHMWRVRKGVITLNESLDDPTLRRSFMGQFEQILDYRQRVGDRKDFQYRDSPPVPEMKRA